MELNLEKIKTNVKDNLSFTNIMLTGLENEEKEFVSILYGNDLIDNNGKKELLIYGSSKVQNEKIEQAKIHNKKCLSISEFKNNFLFNHDKKNYFEGKTILIDVNIDYKSIMSIYLLNPEKVLWSNQINKRKVLDVNVLISNEKNLDKIKDGLSFWIKDVNYDHLFFDGKVLQDIK